MSLEHTSGIGESQSQRTRRFTPSRGIVNANRTSKSLYHTQLKEHTDVLKSTRYLAFLLYCKVEI